MNAAPLTLDVFSDYVCPFCYLEEPELDAVGARVGKQSCRQLLLAVERLLDLAQQR
nr:DsbA family protein [Halomonas socia]